MGIHVRDIQKKFGDFTVLNDVSLDIRPGELVALLGPSGSGKTTLLRIIAGLEFADSGEVLLDGQESADKHVRQRNVGFVFQHYALFKHMTVYENVAFGLKVRKENRPSDAEIRRKVLELLQLVHLDGLHNRYPSQLSGGQRQRVALARALAVEPKVLLLDEPFGALDAKVRKELRRFMRRLHEDIQITSIFVTHDQEEAMEVADRVVVMSNGKIEQIGTPEEVWNRPKNGFVYDFLGNYNVFEGWKDKDGNVHLTEYDVVTVEPQKPRKQPDNGWLTRHPKASQILSNVLPGKVDYSDEFPTLPTRKFKAIRGEGQPVTVYARPHEMILATEADGQEYISAKVVHINPAGSLVKLELERRNGNLLQVEIPPEIMEQLKIKRDQEVLVRPKKTRVFE
jgi:sulfate transport system ATP-binding protein